MNNTLDPLPIPGQSIIYALLDPDTFEVRYVGQTIQKLQQRMYLHYSQSRRQRRTHTNCWIASLETRGLRPVITELSRVPHDEADAEEIRFISHFKDLGYNLTNHHEGGQVNRIVSKQTGRKIAIAKTGKKMPEGFGGRISLLLTGRPKPEGFAQKLSVANKGKKKTPEQIEKHAAALRGVKQKPETIEKRASKLRGRPSPIKGRKQSPESIEKRSEVLRGRNQLPEHVQKRIESLRGRPLSEEHRQKLSEAHKGQVSWNKGKIMSLETREAMSNAHMGQVPWNKGVGVSDKTKQKMVTSHSLTWEVVTPKGDCIVIRNLRQFCTSEGLDVANMHRVATGKQKHYKGWTCRKVEEDNVERADGSNL